MRRYEADGSRGGWRKGRSRRLGAGTFVRISANYTDFEEEAVAGNDATF